VEKYNDYRGRILLPRHKQEIETVTVKGYEDGLFSRETKFWTKRGKEKRKKKNFQ
jgi:hypothetical protein